MRAQEFITEAGTGLDSMHGGHRVKQKVYQTMANAGYKKVGRGLDASVWAKDAGSLIIPICPGLYPYMAETMKCLNYMVKSSYRLAWKNLGSYAAVVPRNS